MITLVVGIIAVILYFNLRKRIENLERVIKNRDVQKQPIAQVDTPLGQHPVDKIPASPYGSAPVAITSIPSGPTSVDKFVSWLKDDWPLKFGVLLLLFGFGWFATYAFAHNWIGPMGRITLGVMAGVLFLALGSWRIKKFLHQGGAFLVLGSTTILLSIFAAREFYDIFTPFSALSVMFLSTAFVAFVSVKYNNRSLALASLILAGVAPLLTNAPTNDYVGLFTYLLVVVLGAIWITILTNRRELTAAALMLLVFYSLPHLSSYSSVSADKGVLLLFIYAFSSIFFLTNISALIRLKGKEIIPDVITAGGNGLLLLAWILNAAQDEWKSLIISAWMIVFVAGSYLIYKFNNNKIAFYTYAGLGVAMLVAATSAELSGASLTIAYAIESAVVSLVIYYALKDLKVASQAAVLLVGPVWLSFESFVSRAWYHGVFNKDFFVLLTMATISFVLGLLFWQEKKKFNDPTIFNIGPILIKVGSVYVYALIWKALHIAIVEGDIATMISLLIYTLVGIFTYFYGKLESKKTFMLYGGIMLGCVIARLFIVDVWEMELTGKIVTFFLLGALLVSTAFIGKKKSEIENINSIKV